MKGPALDVLLPPNRPLEFAVNSSNKHIERKNFVTGKLEQVLNPITTSRRGQGRFEISKHFDCCCGRNARIAAKHSDVHKAVIMAKRPRTDFRLQLFARTARGAYRHAEKAAGRRKISGQR
jgi:hypothetical protein